MKNRIARKTLKQIESLLEKAERELANIDGCPLDAVEETASQACSYIENARDILMEYTE